MFATGGKYRLSGPFETDQPQPGSLFTGYTRMIEPPKLTSSDILLTPSFYIDHQNAILLLRRMHYSVDYKEPRILVFQELEKASHVYFSES